MRINMVRIFAFFPRLIIEFLPGLIVDFFHRLFRRHERHYFVADEVVFQITHPAPTDTTPVSVVQANILASVRSFLPFNRNFLQEVIVSLLPAAGNDWRNRLKPPPQSRRPTSPNSPTPTSRIITISSAEPFSLVPVRVAWHSRSGLRSAAVSRVVQVAYDQLQSGPINLGNGISLQSISPNWFAKNLHHGGNTGGPGSWPLDAVAPQRLGTEASSKISEHKFRLAGPIAKLKPYKDRIRKGKVHVAILDTIPSSNLGQAAQGFMQNGAIAPTTTSLIQYLFTRSPNFTVHPYSNSAELTSLRAYTPPPNHYEMSDHGTFIAGIIHTTAPSATIHLYEVLNSFGLGTLTSMAQGLINAVDDNNKRGDTPLIINCSFMLDLVTQSSVSNLDQLLNLTNPNTSGLLTKSILGVLTWVTSLKNVIVVAAAGNQGSPGVRPYASYPAAFKGVVGVGALPKDFPKNAYPSGQYYIAASYSNFSYDPQNKLPRDGFMTFGGEVDQPITGVPISTKGVLGVYLGNLIRQNSNNTSANNPQTMPSSEGWAHWAGTSFAAAIITGLLAAKPAELERSAKSLPGPYLTVEGENVIVVKQG